MQCFPKNPYLDLLKLYFCPLKGLSSPAEIFSGVDIFFGSDVSRDIHEACEQAELKYGLITSLPHAIKLKKA